MGGITWPISPACASVRDGKQRARYSEGPERRQGRKAHAGGATRCESNAFPRTQESVVSCNLSSFNNPSGHAFRRALRGVLRAVALQAAEKPLTDGVAAILYRHNGNGINPALAT